MERKLLKRTVGVQTVSDVGSLSSMLFNSTTTIHKLHLSIRGTSSCEKH
jgi:hypothetical protein